MLALHTETEMPQTNHQLNAKNSKCCCYFVATRLTAKKKTKKKNKKQILWQTEKLQKALLLDTRKNK